MSDIEFDISRYYGVNIVLSSSKLDKIVDIYRNQPIFGILGCILKEQLFLMVLFDLIWHQIQIIWYCISVLLLIANMTREFLSLVGRIPELM